MLFCSHSPEPNESAGCAGLFRELRPGQKRGGRSFRCSGLGGACGSHLGLAYVYAALHNDSEGLFGHSSPGEESPANCCQCIVFFREKNCSGPPIGHSPWGRLVCWVQPPTALFSVLRMGNSVLILSQVLVSAGCVRGLRPTGPLPNPRGAQAEIRKCSKSALSSLPEETVKQLPAHCCVQTRPGRRLPACWHEQKLRQKLRADWHVGLTVVTEACGRATPAAMFAAPPQKSQNGLLLLLFFLLFSVS